MANVISGDENRSALRSSSPSTSDPTRTPRHRPCSSRRRSATPAASRLRYTAIARRWCWRRRGSASWLVRSRCFSAAGPSGRDSTPATRSAVTRNRDVERLRAAPSRGAASSPRRSARSRPAACAFVALRRAFGSSPALASARAFSITWSGACTHTWPSGSKPGPSRPPGELVELADGEPPHPRAVELRERRHQHGADRDVDADAERVGAADDRQQALRRPAARRGGGSAAACRRGARRRRCARAGRACRRSRGPSGRSAIAAAIASRCGRVVTLRLTSAWARSIAAAWLACTTYTGLSPSPTASRDALGDRRRAPLVVQRRRPVHRRHLGDRPARPLAPGRSVIAVMSPSVADASSIWQFGQLEQRNLPRPAPVAVAVVVELVEAGEPEVARRTGHEGVVGEHLGRAHEHRRVDVDRRVARRQPDARSAPSRSTRSKNFSATSALIGAVHTARRPSLRASSTPATATRLLPDPVGVASTTWSPAASANAASSWCAYSGRPPLGRPLAERVEHGQRIGPRRREEISQRTHTDAQCGVAHELERVQRRRRSTERAITRAMSSTDIAPGRPPVSGSSPPADVSHHRTPPNDGGGGPTALCSGARTARRRSSSQTEPQASACSPTVAIAPATRHRVVRETSTGIGAPRRRPDVWPGCRRASVRPVVHTRTPVSPGRRHRFATTAVGHLLTRARFGSTVRSSDCYERPLASLY